MPPHMRRSLSITSGVAAAPMSDRDFWQFLAYMPVTCMAVLILLMRLTWLPMQVIGADEHDLDGLCVACSFTVASWSFLVEFVRAVGKGRQRLEGGDRKQRECARRTWIFGLGMLIVSNCTSSEGWAIAGNSVAFLLTASGAYIMWPTAPLSNSAGGTSLTESVSCRNILQLVGYLPVTVSAALILVVRLSTYTMRGDVHTVGVICLVLLAPLVFWVLLMEFVRFVFHTEVAEAEGRRQSCH